VGVQNFFETFKISRVEMYIEHVCFYTLLMNCLHKLFGHPNSCCSIHFDFHISTVCSMTRDFNRPDHSIPLCWLDNSYVSLFWVVKVPNIHLPNSIKKLSSKKTSHVDFPDIWLCIPRYPQHIHYNNLLISSVLRPVL